jgi:acyl carrier protein
MGGVQQAVFLGDLTQHHYLLGIHFHLLRRHSQHVPIFDNHTAMSTNPKLVHSDLQHEVAALLVEALNLDITPDTIAPEAPLYGEGLGLDSIDILEVALVVSQRYGFQLRSDDADNVRIFTSLASLTEHIAANCIS